MTADMVNHPPHYGGHPSSVECIEITRQLTFDPGNAVKYVWRAPEKGTELVDLRKASWYLADLMVHGPEHFYVLPLAADLLEQVAQTEIDMAHNGGPLGRSRYIARAGFFRAVATGNVADSHRALGPLLDLAYLNEQDTH